MNEPSPVIFSRCGQGQKQFGVITLNRPKTLNALNFIMVTQMLEKLNDWALDDTIGAVLIKSEHEKAFCAGGDIRQLYFNQDDGMQHSALFFETEYQLNQTIFNFPKPYIALLDGLTMGGGVGISVHGSHRVATEHCQWAMPESKIGFFTDVGASFHLARCSEMVGYYLGLSGRSIDAATAADMGLVDSLVSSAHLQELEQALYATNIDDLQNNHHIVSEVISHFVTPMSELSLAEYYPKIRRCFSMGSVEAIIGALQMEADDWSDQLVQDLTQRSPTSLTVIYKLLNRAINLSFEAVIQQDLIVAKHFLQSDDLFEGIRALLIDKDQKPKWKPAQLADIVNDTVENYFNDTTISR